MKEVISGVTLLCSLALSWPVLADNAIPSNWLLDYHKPTYDVMFSRESTETIGPDTTRVWHKIIYKSPQQSAKGQFSSEIVLVEIDCAQRTIALVRDLRYAVEGGLVSDITTPKAQFVPIKYYGKDWQDTLGDMIKGIGLADDDDVCRTPD